MNVQRRRPAEGLVEQVVLGCGGEVLVAAHDVGDAHQVIVDDVGEVVGRQAVCLDEHVVIQRVAVHLDVAVDDVVKARLALGGDVLADDVGLAGSDARLDLFLAQVQAVLVILEGLALGLRLGALLIQALLGAEAIVRAALFDQLLRVGQVQVLALGLNVRAAGAADVRAFVVDQTGGLHGIVNDVNGALYLALLIGILDAQDELAAVAARPEIGIQRGAQVAQMHIAGRARRKARADFGRHEYRLSFLFQSIGMKADHSTLKLSLRMTTRLNTASSSVESLSLQK